MRIYFILSPVAPDVSDVGETERVRESKLERFMYRWEMADLRGMPESPRESLFTCHMDEMTGGMIQVWVGFGSEQIHNHRIDIY